MRSLLLSVFVLSLTAGVASASDEITGTDAFIRPQRIRAFAVESDRSVVVREGPSTFRRLTTQESCPYLASATRLAFQIGTDTEAVDSGAGAVALTRGAPPPQVSGRTPHAAVVLVLPQGRTACFIDKVLIADESEFQSAADAHGKHDNRYAGDRL